MTGVEQDDRQLIGKVAGGPIDFVLDLLPREASPSEVLAAVLAVRPGGQVVLMGGVGRQGGDDLALPYPWLMRNDITVRGKWMYTRIAVAQVVRLVRAGLIDLAQFNVTKGVHGFVVKADQSIIVEAEGVVAEAVTKFGKLDILVNNPAVFVTGPVGGDVDTAALQGQKRVNVDGVIATTRAAAKVLPDCGRIITIGSGAGTRPDFSGTADYSATKAAVAAFSRVAARDLASRNITVNTRQAGFVATDMNPASSDWAPGWVALIPFGRYGRPEEIAEGVVFLASPDASYVTGSILNIDGGVLA